MTLLSRRKRRTTARRITPATLAANLAALAALFAAPAIAQPPGAPAPGGIPPAPAYRPRTPPPQPQRPPAAPGSSGRIMYFQKPADALTASGAENASEAVAAAPVRSPAVAPAAVPDASAPALLPVPPPPPPSRYLPPEPALKPPVAAPAAAPVTAPGAAPVTAPAAYQPDVVAQKREFKLIPVDPKYVQLPPRENIFMVYNDLELEKAIMERVRQDLKDQGKYNENQEKYLVFPALPVVSP